MPSRGALQRNADDQPAQRHRAIAHEERSGADAHALPFIYEQFNKPENNDAIRVAALLGLVRHLEWDNFRGPVGGPTPAIAGPLRTQIIKTLLDLASQTTPPEGRDPAGHEWMRRRAIEGLTHAGYHQATPELIAAMDTIVKSGKESLPIRTSAATAMGIMAYPASGKLELTPTAKDWIPGAGGLRPGTNPSH